MESSDVVGFGERGSDREASVGVSVSNQLQNVRQSQDAPESLAGHLQIPGSAWEFPLAIVKAKLVASRSVADVFVVGELARNRLLGSTTVGRRAVE